MSSPLPLPLPLASPRAARRAPQVPLPAYAFVPGLQPHPMKGAGGHRHLADGGPAEPPGLQWWAGWRFLHGLDLLDHGYLWEAHEVLEHLWLADPDDAQRRALLQGLIQAAAAALTLHLGRAEAAARLAGRSAARLRAALPGVPGLEGAALAALAERVEGLPGGAPWRGVAVDPTD